MVFDVPNRLEQNQCFCCGSQNAEGMHLQFYRRDDELCCDYQAETRFAGFANVLHGGIQAALLDEVCIWAVAVMHQRLAATAELTLAYLRPVKVTMGLTAVARVVQADGNVFHAEAELRGPYGRARTTARARMQALSVAQFRRFTGWRQVPPMWRTLFPAGKRSPPRADWKRHIKGCHEKRRQELPDHGG